MTSFKIKKKKACHDFDPSPSILGDFRAKTLPHIFWMINQWAQQNIHLVHKCHKTRIINTSVKEVLQSSQCVASVWTQPRVTLFFFFLLASHSVVIHTTHVSWITMRERGLANLGLFMAVNESIMINCGERGRHAGTLKNLYRALPLDWFCP